MNKHTLAAPPLTTVEKGRNTIYHFDKEIQVSKKLTSLMKSYNFGENSSMPRVYITLMKYILIVMKMFTYMIIYHSSLQNFITSMKINIIDRSIRF